jgi:hypothetical protein
MATKTARPYFEPYAPPAPRPTTRSRRRFWLIAALGLLAGLYVVQLVRPLHLESDSVCYLHVAELGAQGRGYTCPGCDRSHCSILYPPGYSWVLARMINAHVASSKSFVVFNFLCIVVGLTAASVLWRRVFELSADDALGLAALFLLWWPVFRLANTPLSDFLFLALAMLSVAAATLSFQSTDRRRQYGMLAASALIAVAAFKVRTVGIALAPAIVWAAIGRPSVLARGRAIFEKHRVLVLGLAGAALALGAAVISRSQYVTIDLRKQYGTGLVQTLIRTWGYRVTEFGELTVDMPAGKLPAAALPILWAVGGGAIALVVWMLWRRRSRLGPTEVFLAATLGIMAIWPFKDARFWLPVLPIFLGLLATYARGLAGVPRRVMVPLATGSFVLVGLAGEAYNTRISLSGDDFPLRFSDDYLGPVYREAWGLPRTTDQVDSTALRILREFEPRANHR